jgi:tripartite-type tricarboxylate transporter receptor subunit TctC
MASPGTGSAPYLAEMLFLQMADMKMTHVPYRGAAPAFSDLIPGRVDCYFGSGTLLSYSRSGQVRALASTGPTRNVAAPDVPAIAEYVPGYEVVSSQALFVPAKTPPEIVSKISADTNTVLADPAIRDKLAETGYMAGGSSPEELGKLLRSEIARWSALIKSVGITLDQSLAHKCRCVRRDWHIATDHILIGDGRFRDKADMPRPRAAYRWVEFDPKRT